MDDPGIAAYPHPIPETNTRTDTRDLLALGKEQARRGGYNDYFIVDVDAHHADAEGYEEVLRYMDDFPVIQHEAFGWKRASGRITSIMNAQPGVFNNHVAGRIHHHLALEEHVSPEEGPRDVVLAHRAMDALGIDCTIMFPNAMLSLGLHPRIEIEVAFAFAYNRWALDTLVKDQKRLKFMPYLPFNDPEACYRTVEEFGDKPGVIGFTVSGSRFRAVHHNAYMKLYRMIEERGLPIAFHAGRSWDDQYLKQLNRFITVHAISFVLCSQVHLANWIINGLPERFPKLKVVWIESGLAWVPFMMQRLDNMFLMRSSEAPLLKRRPSDYMREMYYSSQPMERTDMDLLRSTFKAINAETQLLYASDWPHWDFDMPSVIFDLPFLSEQAKRNILGLNAQRLFNLQP